jgi:hypothetical protein
MDARVYIVLGIIVFTGLLGGYGAYLLENGEQPPEQPQRRVLLRSLLLGIIAALAVPLFLSLTKSGLMGNIFAKESVPPTPPAFEDYLIFAGLCVIAAVSARRFITSVTERLLQRVDQAERTAADAHKKAEEAKVEVLQGEEADEANASPPISLDSLVAPGAMTDSSSDPLTKDQQRVLEAMTMRTYRTRTGIADDSGVPRNRISELLEALADRQLVQPAKSPRTGGARWTITDRGNSALRSAASG